MTAGVNTLTDLAKAGLATQASPGGAFDWGVAGSTINALLVNTTEDSTATATQQGYTLESSFNANEHATANGYTQQGLAPGSQVVTIAAHVTKATMAAAVWTATTTLTAFGIWFVKHVGAAGSNPALGYWSFNASVSATGASFTVTPSGTGLFTIT